MRKRKSLAIVLIISLLLFSGCDFHFKHDESIGMEESGINIEVSEGILSE